MIWINMIGLILLSLGTWVLFTLVYGFIWYRVLITMNLSFPKFKEYLMMVVLIIIYILLFLKYSEWMGVVLNG